MSSSTPGQNGGLWVELGPGHAAWTRLLLVGRDLLVGVALGRRQKGAGLGAVREQAATELSAVEVAAEIALDERGEAAFALVATLLEELSRLRRTKS